jgi:hypothetical protein
MSSILNEVIKLIIDSLCPMKPHGSLLAWITPHGPGKFVGAFVGEDAASGTSRDFPGPQACDAALFVAR